MHSLLVLYVNFVREENADTPIKFTYTPLHGVGQKFAEAAFDAFNFPPLISVPEQVSNKQEIKYNLMWYFCLPSDGS